MGIPQIKPYPMPSKENLPENKVSWTLKPERSMLLIHDMQQYFLNPFTPKTSPIIELVNNIAVLRDEARKKGIPIVYTAQPGAQHPEDRRLLTDFWGPGLDDTKHLTKIIDELSPSDEDTVLKKWRYSAFKRSELLQIMQKSGRDQIIICGVYAHIGCLMTAGEAFMLDQQAFLVADAVADFSEEDHRMALKYAAGRCARTLTAENVLFDWSEQSTFSLMKEETGHAVR